MAEEPQKDPRVYFAEERTFLAWIRTGLALMGVGFAVARFSFFLQQLRATQAHAPAQGNGLSVWSGVAIVALGVLVLVAAGARHFRITRQLSNGRWQPGRVSRSAVALASMLALLGVAIAVYLIVVR